jgi:hypothetical protein
MTPLGQSAFLFHLIPPRGRPAFEEHAQNGVRRDLVPNPLGGARRTLRFFVTRSFNEWQKVLAKQSYLYDRRMAVYVAFWELLTGLPDAKKSHDDIKALLFKANSARYQAPFLFDNVNLPSYLQQLCTEIAKDVIGTNMYLDAMSKQAAAIQNTPEAAKGIAENTQRLAAATVNIPERHLKEIVFVYQLEIRVNIGCSENSLNKSRAFGYCKVNESIGPARSE